MEAIAAPVPEPGILAWVNNEIRRIARRKTAEGMLEIGELLHGMVLQGQPATRDHPSLHALAASPTAPLKQAALYRAARSWEQARLLPEDIRRELTVSQHYALLPAPEEAKVELAREAVSSAMTVADLQAKVRAALGKPPPRARRRARPSAPSVGSATRLLSPWKKKIDAGRRPTPAEATKVLREIGELRSLLDELHGWAIGEPAPDEDGLDDGVTATAAGRMRL